MIGSGTFAPPPTATVTQPMTPHDSYYLQYQVGNTLNMDPARVSGTVGDKVNVRVYTRDYWGSAHRVVVIDSSGTVVDEVYPGRQRYVTLTWPAESGTYTIMVTGARPHPTAVVEVSN
jgi:hypothetical protein